MCAGAGAVKKTPWLPGSVSPVREGWYERDYTEIFGGGSDPAPHVHLDLWQQAAPGVGFWYVDQGAGINDAYYEDLPWRGVEK